MNDKEYRPVIIDLPDECMEGNVLTIDRRQDYVDKKHQMYRDNLQILADWSSNDGYRYLWKRNAKGKKTTCVFDVKDKPYSEFYPSSGKWHSEGYDKEFNGGADAFIEWFKKQ